MSSSIDELPVACQTALDYANSVVLDEIHVCKLVHLSVDRFFVDLKRAELGGPYVVDWAEADRAMRFVQRMPHIKGPDAGQNIILSPWQKFIYLNIYGWKVRATGDRRFKKVYVEVPRGNGKSTMVSPAALYMISADGEGGAEVYSAAVTRDQARIVFNVAKAMALQKPAFMKRAGVSIYTHSISQDKSNSMFQPLSADSRGLDGLNIHMAILDELAQHKKRDVHDVMETGMGKRNQPLMWMITTAGNDQGGIGFEVHDYAVKVLEGTMQDDSFFPMIYTVDDGDDWTQEKTWIKANPNWGISVVPDMIKQMAQRAISIPSFQNAFKIKHLNIWTNASTTWMDGGVWSKQAIPIDESDLQGCECIIGLDLSTKTDLAAAVKVFRQENTAEVSSKNKYRYIIVPKLYLPETALNSNTNYEGWSLGGHLVLTPGDVIDFDYIEEDLKQDIAEFNVKEIAFDPWQAMQLSQHMVNDAGAPMVEFPATVRNFSEPTKEFEVLARQGLLLHNNNPCFNWMISNLVVKEDRKGNIFPRKERRENKIDGPVAAIMALARWILNEYEEQGSIYDNLTDNSLVL